MVNVDISNIWCSVTLRELLECEREIARAHEALTDSCQGNFLSWLDDESGWKSELLHVEQKAAAVKEHSKVLVVVGNDSATWGLRALCQLLDIGQEEDNLELVFVGSDFSSRSWKKLTTKLENMDFSVHVISELGDDLECAVAVRGLRWLLTRRYGAEIAREHLFVTTSKSVGTLRALATEEGYTAFTAMRSITGHNSILCPGNLFPLVAIGVDLRQFFRGAMGAKEELSIRSFENPAWLYAGARSVLGRKGKIADYMCLTEPEQAVLGDWWRKLFSIRSGEYGILPAVMSCPEEVGDLQPLLLHGVSSVMETVLRFAFSGERVQVEMAWNDVDGLRAIEGCTFENLREQAVETVIAMAGEADVPLITVDFDKKNLKTMGEMLYFFELSASLYGDMTGWKAYGSRPENGFQCQFRQNLQK